MGVRFQAALPDCGGHSQRFSSRRAGRGLGSHAGSGLGAILGGWIGSLIFGGGLGDFVDRRTWLLYILGL